MPNTHQRKAQPRHAAHPFKTDLAHIITKIDMRDGVIVFNQNADRNLIKNFCAALAAFADDADIDHAYPDEVCLNPEVLGRFKNPKSRDDLAKFYTDFLNLQKRSMLDAITQEPGLSALAIDSESCSSGIILQKSEAISTLATHRLRSSLVRYRDKILCTSQEERARLAASGYIGPSHLDSSNRDLVKILKAKRGQGKDMFEHNIFAIEPTDILFFNNRQFTEHYHKIVAEERRKEPADLINTRFLKGINPIALITNIVLIPVIILTGLINIAFRKQQQHSLVHDTSARSSAVHDKIADSTARTSTYISKPETLREIGKALEYDLTMLRSSRLNGAISDLILGVHTQFERNTLAKRKHACYDLHNSHMSTSFENDGTPVHTKGVTKRGSVIAFYGQTEMEAREVIMHELLHVICHKIEHRAHKEDIRHYSNLLDQSAKWLKQFCYDHDINFATTDTMHMRGTIVQGLDYHKGDGIDYIANLVPKILQARAMATTDFDQATSNNDNPVNKLFGQLNRDAERLLAQDRGLTRA
jgi:hypothetical protein